MILEILGSAGFGSLLGGIFGFLNKREERKNLEMRFEHETNLIKAKTDAAIRTAEIGMKTAELTGKLEVEKEETKAFTVSQSSSGVGDTIKAVVRPLIVAILLYQTYKILTSLEELTGGMESLSSEQAMELYKIVILMVTGLTCTAVSWYFAARSSKQFDKMLEDAQNNK